MPKSWYRKSRHWGSASGQDADLYHDERYITAAAIVERDIKQYALLVDPVPWAMIVLWPINDWALVLVSAADPRAWVATAQTLGARAWHTVSTGELYEYRPPEPSTEPEPAIRYENYGGRDCNHQAIVEDILSGQYTGNQVCERHRVSRQTIATIKRLYNIPLAR
jgi:hypothetical protein